MKTAKASSEYGFDSVPVIFTWDPKVNSAKKKKYIAESTYDEPRHNIIIEWIHSYIPSESGTIGTAEVLVLLHMSSI